ncbi:MAG: AmmeMemoRadiSam system protein B, partial [Candidatus Micrarchaeia archaeon]
MELKIRRAAVANSFYAGDEQVLRREISKHLGAVEEQKLPGKLRGLVEPHAGYIYSGPVAAYGYKLLEYAEGIRRVIILGPSHYAAFAGVCEAGADEWETPLGRMKAYSIAEKVNAERPLVQVFPQAHAPEHCLEVQLPFLQAVMKNDFEVCPLLCGKVDVKLLAEALAPLVDEKTLVIASSDLSHYLPYDEAVKKDKIANEAVPSLDIVRFEKQGDACGKTPILVLMHLAKLKKWKGKMLDYRNS